MAHILGMKFLGNDKIGKAIEFELPDTHNQEGVPHNKAYLVKAAIANFSINYRPSHETSEEQGLRLHLTVEFIGGAGYGEQEGYDITETQLANILLFFWGISSDTVPTDGTTVDVADIEATPELQLVQDPVIYNRPETGLSQQNVPFFKFHNPNGKSAITISMVDVDHTRFDSNSDDTHHYIVVTKARIEIRCLCTVNEQLGLEFRFRGTTHVISAEESNNVRLITESRANPR